MEDKITGLMMYYHQVCLKKLWYSTHHISLECFNENVQIGKSIDENTYKREKHHFNINDEINIDFIAHHHVVHEVKKSKSIEEASIFQVKYYLYYLHVRGIRNIIGKLDYPLLRETVKVTLEEEDIPIIEGTMKNVLRIKKQVTPPIVSKKKFCKECAFYDLCFV